MVGNKKLPNALSKNPNPFVDVDSGLMNVPKGMDKIAASGVDFSVGGTVPTKNLKNGKGGFKAGAKEGSRLVKRSRKSATRRLRA